MVATETPDCNTGWKAPGFDLPGVDGRRHSLDALRGEHGTLVMFLCNHCPYVKAVFERIVRDANDLAADGIACVAISSNDVGAYPADSFDNMKHVAAEKKFPFPYLYDESQEVARAYGAVCTPDFFGLNADDELCYRGRLDKSRTEAAPDAKRDLFEAMRQVARTGKGPDQQIASIGCSIKWRDEA